MIRKYSDMDVLPHNTEVHRDVGYVLCTCGHPKAIAVGSFGPSRLILKILEYQLLNLQDGLRGLGREVATGATSTGVRRCRLFQQYRRLRNVDVVPLLAF
jgi:hypothetical protein